MKNKIILTIMGFAVLLLAGCGGDGTSGNIMMPELPPIKTAFEQADTSEDGKVSFTEAQNFIMNNYEGFTLSRSQFDQFDVIGDPDGFLSMQEVERFAFAYTTDIVDVVSWIENWTDTGNTTAAVTTNRTSVTEGDFKVIYSDTTASTKEQSRTEVKYVLGGIEDNTSYVLRTQTQDVITIAAISGTFVSKTRISGTLDNAVWGDWAPVSPTVTQGGVTTNRPAVTEGDFTVIYSDTTSIDTKETRSQFVNVNGETDSTAPELAADELRWTETTAAISGTFVSKTQIDSTVDTVAWGDWTATSTTRGGVSTTTPDTTEGDFSVHWNDSVSKIETTETRSQSVQVNGEIDSPAPTLADDEERWVDTTAAVGATKNGSTTRITGTMDTVSVKNYTTTTVTSAGAESGRVDTGTVGSWVTIVADQNAPNYQVNLTQERTVEERVSFNDDTVSKAWIKTYTINGVDDRTNNDSDNQTVINTVLTGTDTGLSQTKADQIVNTKTEQQQISNPNFVAVVVTSELTGTIPSAYSSIDANEDGYITLAEARASWSGLSITEKAIFIDALSGLSVLSLTVAEADAIMSSTQYNAIVVRDILLVHLNGIDGTSVTIATVDFHGAADGDDGSHGTHVKNIIDSIAPGASSRAIDIGLNATVQGIYDEIALDEYNNGSVNVYNFSLGSYEADGTYTYPEDLTFYEDAKSSNWDAVIVVAAGNDYRGDQTYYDHDGDSSTPEIANGIVKDCSVLEKCNDLALNMLYNSTETTIVVGAMNDEGTALESYSTPAGVLQEHYLAAPVWKDSNNGRGTSYAAPVVAGVAGLLMDNLDSDDAQDVKTKILESADGLGTCENVDQGTSCTDDTYGHGKLNVSKALAPVGGLI